MGDAGQTWRRFWKGPDAAMLVAGGEGERQVAMVRVVVVGLLLITPTYRLAINPANKSFFWGFVVTLVAMLFALFVQGYLRRRPYRPWIGFMSASVDGSLVTCALTLFVIVGSPLSGVNDRITFEVYFLVIMAISLRQDRRICVLVGGFIVLQYGLLVLYAATFHDLQAAALKSPYLGRFSPSDQWTRIILLASAVFISHAYVSKSDTLVNRAIRDPLTGLLNRGFFDTLFNAEVERAKRYKQHLAVVMLDADHFKRINDTHGHLMGDAVLKAMAELLRTNLRESDFVVRYGGEEFVILLHEIGPAAALEKMEALRAMIEKQSVPLPSGDGAIQFTISAGISIYPEDGSEVDELLTSADERLMRAKQEGRNRVVAAPRTAGS